MTLTMLRQAGAHISYCYEQRSGLLRLAANSPPPSMQEAVSLFERLDARCLRVIVIADDDALLGDYAREPLPWDAATSAVLH